MPPMSEEEEDEMEECQDPYPGRLEEAYAEPGEGMDPIHCPKTPHFREQALTPGPCAIIQIRRVLVMQQASPGTLMLVALPRSPRGGLCGAWGGTGPDPLPKNTSFSRAGTHSSSRSIHVIQIPRDLVMQQAGPGTLMLVASAAENPDIATNFSKTSWLFP